LPIKGKGKFFYSKVLFYPSVEEGFGGWFLGVGEVLTIFGRHFQILGVMDKNGHFFEQIVSNGQKWCCCFF
jgi:hypothetical protein